MINQKKKNYIITYIGDYIELFYKQAYWKIKKRKPYITSDSDHKELVSDVIYSIMNNLDSQKSVNFYYEMAVDQKLHLYILKAIDTNCRSGSAPFHYNRSKLKHYKIFNEQLHGINDNDKAMDADTKTLSEYSDNKILIIKKIYKLLEADNAKRLLGDDWKYYTTLFYDYINEPYATYKSISENYRVSESTIFKHINKVKKMLHTNLK